MAELRYDISVVGADKLQRVLRSTERALADHQRRAMRMVGSSTAAARRGAVTSNAGQARELKATFRGFEEIGKVAAREEMRRHREAMSNIKKEEQAKIRAARKVAQDEERAQKRAVQVAQQTRMRMARGIATSAGNAVRGMASTAAGVVGLGGGAVAVNAVRQKAETDGLIANLANQGFQKGGPSRGKLASEIRGRVAAVSNASGRSDQDIVTSMRSFVDVSGDLKGAMRLLPKMTEIADASGASGEDVGKSLAMTLQGIKNANPKMSSEEAEKKALAAIRTVAGQGKIGAIELRDVAGAGIARTVAAASQYGGDFETNMAKLGGMSQLAFREGGAASPDEAFMAISRLSSDAISKQGALKKMGVDVFTDKTKTQLKSPDEIMFDIIKKTKGDLSKVAPLFQERSIRAVNPLKNAYVNAGGGKAGEDAMRKLLGEFQNAGMSEKEVQDSAEFRRSQEDRKMAKVWNEFNRTLGTELMPVVTQAIPELAKAIPALTKGIAGAAKFMQWFIDNPIKGIGGVILATIAKDILAAKVGEGIVRMIAGGLPGGRGGAPGVPGGGGGGGGMALPLVAATLATGALVDDQIAKLDKQIGYKGPSMNPFADKDGKMGSDSFLQGLIDNALPFGENSFGAKIGRGIGGRYNAIRKTLNEPIAKPRSGKDYDAFMQESGVTGVADFDVNQILTEKQLERYGLDKDRGFIYDPKKTAEESPEAAAAAQSTQFAQSLGDANGALSSFASKLREWSPPDTGRGPDPITKPS